MVLFINRRQAEMIMDSLKSSMKSATPSELDEYKITIDRIGEVTSKQCKKDKSRWHDE